MAMNGSTLTYCRSGGHAFGDRDQAEAGVEAKHVREEERRDAEHGVRDDVEHDQQAIVPTHHARVRAPR